MRDNLIIRCPVNGDVSGGCAKQIDGWYVAARPEGFSSFWYRIKATWLVWTGRADALVWPSGQ